VTLAQCHVLLEIEDQGQATAGQLAEQLGLDKSTLSRTIDGLVNIGLVGRLPHPSDRRFTPLTLTKRGKDTCNAFNRDADDYYGRVLSNIPEAGKREVLKYFALLVQGLAEEEDQHGIKSECCD
jgi:DNA-binding MarR family transcriptional regulator